MDKGTKGSKEIFLFKTLKDQECKKKIRWIKRSI